MSEPRDDRALRSCAERIEELLRDVEKVAGPLAWARVQSLVTELVELYGAGLARVLEHAAASAADRHDLDRRLAGDDLVASLLALHDIHPIPLAERVERAIDRARAQVATDAKLELEGIEAGVANVRVSGAQTGRGVMLQQLVARAIENDVPEITSVRVEGTTPPAPPPDKLVSVARLVHKARP